MAHRMKRMIGDTIVYAEDAEGERGRNNTTASLRAGDFAPEFRLSDADGRIVSLSATLKSGPVVLCFLDTRAADDAFGELQAMARHAGGIIESGATILALSPHSAAWASPIARLKVLVDAGRNVASAYRLCPPPPGSQSTADTLEGNSQFDKGGMKEPVPATFVINQHSRIVLSLIDAAFDNGIVPANVMAALHALHRR